MNNEFIPYEQALELKELGFEEPCMAAYVLGQFYIKGDNYIYGSKDIPNINAPLYQQAFRWFREKYDLQCWLHDGGMLGKCFIKIIGYRNDKFYFSSSEPMEYEEAELACLKKLIEIIKNK